MVWVPDPTLDGVYVTEHRPIVLEPTCARLHVPLPEKDPEPLVVNVTLPCGHVAEPPDCASWIVAAHVVEEPTPTGFGAQETPVDVWRRTWSTPEVDVVIVGLPVAVSVKV
jgi:hypothetical protein